MKIRLMIILGIAAILFTNCTKSEIDFPSNTATVVASMESDAVKSSATDEGYFTWVTGDTIAIHTNNNSFLVGTLTKGNGTPNGSFSYSFIGNDPELSGYALYPYNEGHRISENEVTFVMPASYELGETLANTNSPMIATPVNKTEVSANYDFSHLGGLFRFVIKNAPIGANKFTLRLGGKKINGSFEVSLGETTPQIVTTDGSDENNVTTLTFAALESVQDITLFVPVPVGEYTGIKAKLYDDDVKLGEWGSDNASNTVARRSLKLMAPITFSNAGGNIENEIPVGSATQLEDALQNDGVVVMTEPITLSEQIEVPAGVSTTLDLQGQTLVNGEFSIVVGEGATLNIINSGAQTKSASSATIVGSGDIIKASKGATINISAGISLTSTDNCCIFVPQGADGAKITTAGNLLSQGNYATVQVNGLVESGTINITGGSIKHTTEIPLYIAGNVNVTISGNPTIESVTTTALEQRAGNLTINGGTFIAKGDFTVVENNNNGSTTTGVAVAICQHSTKKETRAIINGGTFTGAKGVYMQPYDDSQKENVSLVVKGGTFNNLDNIYLAEGYGLKFQANNDGTYDVVQYCEVTNGTYSISTAEALFWLAREVNSGSNYFEGKTVVLTHNIDLNNEEWIPIGSASQDHGFMGNFDGNGKTIKNLSITNITTDSDGYVYAGLFGVTEGTDINTQNYIKDLTIENVNISTQGHIVAAAIAYPHYTIVENITVQGDISITGGDYTAGILAYTRRCVDAKDLEIKGNTGSSITGASTVGGVISDIQMNGGLTANYSNFSASGLTITATTSNVGGISGIISAQTLDGATVNNVTINCAKGNKTIGIVSGALGSTSIVKNISYSNVTGATNVIGAMYNTGNPAYCHGPYESDNKYYFVPEVTVSGSDEIDKMREALSNGAYIKANGYSIQANPVNGACFVHTNKSIIDGEGGSYLWNNDGGTPLIKTSGGTLKNLRIYQTQKAIVVVGQKSKVVLENVEVSKDWNVNHAIHADEGNGDGLEATNCKFYALISYAAGLGDVKFTSCTFGANKSGNKGINAYASTEFVGCAFEEGCTVYLSDNGSTVTFENCTYKGVAITTDNLSEVVTGNIQNASVK